MNVSTKIIIVVAISVLVVLGAYLDGTPLIDIPNLFN